MDDGTYAAAMRSGRPDRRSVFSRFTESGVVWEDGARTGRPLATGYGPNLGYLGPWAPCGPTAIRISAPG